MIKPKKTRVRLSPERREHEILQYCAKIVAEQGVFAVSIEPVSYTHLTLPTTPYV